MIHHETEGSIAVLRMEHGKANALDTELLEGLGGAFEELRPAEAEAVVLTGTGSIFSAGVDLFRILEGGGEYLGAFLPALSQALLRLFTFPRPVVAAINGHAIAGGCILACACDLKVMADGPGRIGVPELRVGVPFPTVALETLRFAVPRQHIQALAYAGKTFLPDEALHKGLVDEVMPPERVRERSIEAARDLASIPAETFELTKRQLRRPTLERIETLTDEVDPRVADVWARAETHRVIGDYLERTVGRRA